MGPILSFVVGVAVGLIVAWWFFERRDAASREAMEAGWKKKLDHVEAEVKRADAAHEETKERLRRLQQEKLPAPETPAATEPTSKPPAPATAPPAVAPSPTARPTPTSAQPLVEAERIAQAKRRIDAKLAQLPAGSSARKRLKAERAALDRAAEKPAVEERLFTPPAEPPDDLERIRGIGPVLRQRLNRLGITTFAQVAAFTEADLKRIDDVLDFNGRIVREDWVEQAKELRDQA
jgi:predicted flap endonuclease-1-like 5' DNA nuclease